MCTITEEVFKYAIQKKSSHTIQPLFNHRKLTFPKPCALWNKHFCEKHLFSRERREYSIKSFVLVLPHELAVVVINEQFYYFIIVWFNVCVVALKNTVRIASSSNCLMFQAQISPHRLHFLPAYSFQWFYKFFYEKNTRFLDFSTAATQFRAILVEFSILSARSTTFDYF